MALTSPPMTVTKLDAARRQLQTAIRLWFQDADPVSIHTLAAAAYEIIHAVSKQRNPKRRKLLFDMSFIRDEYRAEFARKLKEPGNSNNPKEQIIEYNPDVGWGFILFAVLGAGWCGERCNAEETAFLRWQFLHYPQLFTEEWRKKYTSRLSDAALNRVLSLPKSEFPQVSDQIPDPLPEQYH
jgi:hypothetical protein